MVSVPSRFFMRTHPLVIGNWKLYIETPKEATLLVKSLRKRSRSFSGVEAWVATPATLLPAVVGALKGSALRVGVQTISSFDTGAHTGEVSALSARASGAHFSIIGHSERRARGESNEDVRAQLVQAASAGLVPVLCVGETERSQDGAHFSVVAEQIRSALSGTQSLTGKLIVAYEPVWAIGKGASDAMKASDVREMAIFIKKTLAESLERPAALKVPILYGGSVEPENAASLYSEGGVAGFLVGHASAKAETFISILVGIRQNSR